VVNKGKHKAQQPLPPQRQTSRSPDAQFVTTGIGTALLLQQQQQHHTTKLLCLAGTSASTYAVHAVEQHTTQGAELLGTALNTSLAPGNFIFLCAHGAYWAYA
jgi:hypothetical protein